MDFVPSIIPLHTRDTKHNKHNTTNTTEKTKTQTIKHYKLPTGLINITNTGIHNLTLPEYGLTTTTKHISPLEELILSLGPDFIPQPVPLTREDLCVAVIDYKQRIRRKYMNYFSNDNIANPLSKLNKSQHKIDSTDNKCTSAPLETYLHHVHNKILPFIPYQTVDTTMFTFYTNDKLNQKEYKINYENINKFVKQFTSPTARVKLINDPKQYPQQQNCDPHRSSKHHQLLLPADTLSPNPIFTTSNEPEDSTACLKIIMKTTKQLLKDKTIVINNTDKNLGLAIMPIDWYINQAIGHLKDETNYVRIHIIPLSTTIFDLLIQSLHLINKFDQYKSKTSQFIFDLDPRYNKTIDIHKRTPTSTFYMLPKVHKPKIGTRPIVASIGSLTYNASKIVDNDLQPVIRFFPSILLNSLELNRHMATNIFPEGTHLFSADVRSLYPNIDIIDGLNAMKIALKRYNKCVSKDLRIDIDYILILTAWILNNNYLSFGDSTWRQISGTAMGTPMAVVFANLYLLVLEWETYDILKQQPTFVKPLLFGRFIDDLFLISTDEENGLLFLNTFDTRRERIKLDITHGKTVIILDLETTVIESQQGYSQIIVKIYQKPMNRYLYIPQFSHHQVSMFQSFITSEIRRYRLSCSLDTDFETTCTNFAQRLKERGYTTEIYEHCKQAFQTTRNDLLFTNECKQYYENISSTPTPQNLCRPFLPFRIQQGDTTESPLTIFRIPHAPGIANNQLKKILNFEPYRQLLASDHFPEAMDQFCKTPTLCKTRTYKIQDSLIRSKFQHQLPDEF